MYHQTKDFISKSMAVRVIISGTFLCRPLQRNAKCEMTAFSGEREPQQVVFSIYEALSLPSYMC